MRHSKKAVIKNSLLFKSVKGVTTPFQYFVKESKNRNKPNISKLNGIKNLKLIWSRMGELDKQIFEKLTKIDERRYMNEISVIASTIKLYRKHFNEIDSSDSSIDEESDPDRNLEQIVSRLHGWKYNIVFLLIIK